MKGESEKKDIFIDIDGTIVEDISCYTEVGYFEYALSNILTKKYSLSPSDSLKEVLKAEEKVMGKDPFLALSFLGFEVSEGALWKEILKIQKKVLKIYPDAVWLIKKLYNTGDNLYIYTNNTVNRALAKLTCAGLANRTVSKYFKKIYGYDFAGCQKDSSDFYHKILRDREFNMENIVIVGDDPVCDMKIPAEVGIKKFIIVNREQRESIIEKDGSYFVNDLKLAFEILG